MAYKNTKHGAKQIKCPECKKTFKSYYKWGSYKIFCSRLCFARFRKGKARWERGQSPIQENSVPYSQVIPLTVISSFENQIRTHDGSIFERHIGYFDTPYWKTIELKTQGIVRIESM